MNNTNNRTTSNMEFIEYLKDNDASIVSNKKFRIYIESIQNRGKCIKNMSILKEDCKDIIKLVIGISGNRLILCKEWIDYLLSKSDSNEYLNLTEYFIKELPSPYYGFTGICVDIFYNNKRSYSPLIKVHILDYVMQGCEMELYYPTTFSKLQEKSISLDNLKDRITKIQDNDNIVLVKHKLLYVSGALGTSEKYNLF